MITKIASCFVLACSVMFVGCIGGETEVDSSDDMLAPQSDADGVWTKVTTGVWERTRPNDAVEHYVVGVNGMSWLAERQEEALSAFQEEVGATSGEALSEDQQKNLAVLEANLDATEKALEKLSLEAATEEKTPGLHPEYFTSGVMLGSCSDFLVAGPTSGTGAYAYSSINPSCPSFYLSAYVAANNLSGSISTASSRAISASITNGTYNCMSQAYAQANGWGHTLTYPYCN